MTKFQPKLILLGLLYSWTQVFLFVTYLTNIIPIRDPNRLQNLWLICSLASTIVFKCFLHTWDSSSPEEVVEISLTLVHVIRWLFTGQYLETRHIISLNSFLLSIVSFSFHRESNNLFDCLKTLLFLISGFSVLFPGLHDICKISDDFSRFLHHFSWIPSNL